MVPVIDRNNTSLMPCSEKRARKLMEKGQAEPLWKNQIFCIRLLKNPSDRKFQDVIIGIDPGSKKEGITVATESKVVLNITMEAVTNIKDNLETRKNLRRSRRRRNTPYRKCRFNRTIGNISPSTKARWDQKLRVLTLLQKIIPITILNVEDISTTTKKGCKKWNQNFSPLEVGKTYFEEQIKEKDLMFLTTQGFQTKEHRDIRGFKKTKNKLDNIWEAHCVDSHSLAEIASGNNINPFKGMYIFENFNFKRRQLHVQNPIKNGVRKEYGSTISLGIPRGSLVIHPKFGLSYVGGTSKGRISLHCSKGKRLTQGAKKEDLKVLNINKWRTQFLPTLKWGVSLRKKV